MKIKIVKDIFITSLLIGLLAFAASWYLNIPLLIPTTPIVRSFVALLWSPLRILPSDFIQSLQPTGCLDICLPTFSQLLLYICILVFSAIILGSICVIISSLFLKIVPNNIYSRFFIRAGILFFIVLTFSFHQQYSCVNDFRNGISHDEFNSVRYEEYLSNTGTLIIISTDNFPDASELQKYFGINVLSAERSAATLNVVRVPIGHEFEYACKLQNYFQRNSSVTPISRSNLNAWRQYIDQNYWLSN